MHEKNRCFDGEMLVLAMNLFLDNQGSALPKSKKPTILQSVIYFPCGSFWLEGAGAHTFHIGVVATEPETMKVCPSNFMAAFPS